MRYVAIAAAVLLAALPVYHDDGGFIVTLSTVAAVSMIVGIFQRSLLAAAGGGGLALLAYVAALWWTGATPGLLEPMLFGIALMLAIDAADLGRSLGGAEISAAVLRLLQRRWIVSALLGAGAVVGLAGLMALADPGAPPVMRPLLAGIGGFLALIATLLLLKRS